MERYLVRQEVGKHAWEGSTIEIIQDKPDECNMDCVSFCFTDFTYRFENVETIDQTCLKAQCDCYTGSVTYEPQIISQK
jgi:hypothetical protein